MSAAGQGAAAFLGLCLILAAAIRLTGAWGPEPATPQNRIPASLRPAAAPSAAPQAPFRIVALGTSLTRNAAWPDELSRRLSACAGRPVSVVRVARAGASSDWGRGQAAAVAALEPDLVLVEFAVNDADIRGGQTLKTSLANHLSLITALAARAPGAGVMLMTMNTATGLRGLLRPWLAAHHAQYRSLAAAEGLGLVDLAPLWAAALAGEEGRALMPDGLHPTDAAVAAVALPAMTAGIGRLLPGCG